MERRLQCAMPAGKVINPKKQAGFRDAFITIAIPLMGLSDISSAPMVRWVPSEFPLSSQTHILTGVATRIKSRPGLTVKISPKSLRAGAIVDNHMLIFCILTLLLNQSRGFVAESCQRPGLSMLNDLTPFIVAAADSFTVDTRPLRSSHT
jgi:hypothetical protein